MVERRLGHRVFMLAFVAAPVVTLAVLVYAMTAAMEHGPSMVAEPVGAGAGRTGGANALGERLFGGSGDLGIPADQTARGAVLVVHDGSGRAGPDRPLLLLTNHEGWRLADALTLTQREDGAWEIRLPPPRAGENDALAFRFVLGPEGLPEVDESAEPVGERRLPRISQEQAVGEVPLRYEFAVRGFGAG
ncbi:MAG: hypothetical protein IPJ41_06845 [Phycisphaerales bacterium]|nr:hypothetical protein [Phycisphaerales bacterium]